jgi:diacylglycerol kinase family enzyme
VGKVNQYIFLNFTILGLYTRIAHEKQEKRKRGKNKWFALLVAAIKTWIKNPAYRVRLRYGTKALDKKVSLLFIGNNQYEFYGADLLGHKVTRSSATLQIGIIEWTHRYRLLLLLIKAMFGHLFYDEYADKLDLQRITVEGKGQTLVGIDGEIIIMKYPLHFIIKPKSLKIIIP